MRLGILTALILASLSVASALNPDDRLLLTEIKEITELTRLQIYQLSLRYVIGTIESIVNAQVVDRELIQRLQSLKLRQYEKLRRPILNDSDLENVLDDLLNILGLADEDEANGMARMAEYTNGSFEKLIENYQAQMKKEIHIFIYITTPKVRKLSRHAQQTERELITAFNDVAYAGLVPMENLFDTFYNAIEKY